MSLYNSLQVTAISQLNLKIDYYASLKMEAKPHSLFPVQAAVCKLTMLLNNIQIFKLRPLGFTAKTNFLKSKGPRTWCSAAQAPLCVTQSSQGDPVVPNYTLHHSFSLSPPTSRQMHHYTSRAGQLLKLSLSILHPSCFYYHNPSY